MPHLAIFLLGSLQVQLDAQPVGGLDALKARALLAYLVTEAAHPHRREVLAALLWPDSSDALARRSLSQALFTVRRALSDDTNQPPFFLSTRDIIQFNPASDYALDVQTFQKQLAQVHGHPHPALATCATCLAQLAEAVAHYAGDFLQDISVADSQPFDEWVLLRREALRRQLLETLADLTNAHEQRHDLAAALRYARQQLEHDPWREETHRQVMRLLARAGERSAALAQFEAGRRVLRSELGVEPAAETVELFEQIKQGALTPDHQRVPSRATPPAAKPLPPREPRHTLLPSPITPFVGRQPELAALTQLLRDPHHRLITLVGPGGIGKTRLAWHVAHDQQGMYGSGAAFVPLAAVTAADGLATAMAHALNLVFHGLADPQTRLLDFLRRRELLLILDNCEHLVVEIEASDLLVRILEDAPGVRVMATSREPLGIWGETVFDVPGLPVAGDDTDGSAVTLFVQRAQRVNRHFELTPAILPAVTRICQLVDGMPLGIELAATWLRTHSCDEIAAEIERDLGFLHTTARGLPERHRSLRAVFEHSWQLLDTEERTLLGQLAVFRGGFHRDAAEQVTGASRGRLATLSAKSLLRRSQGGTYDLHEVIRQYAWEKLHELELATVTRARHLAYYTRLAQTAAPALWGVHQDVWLEQLEQEHDNLRAALVWSLEAGDQWLGLQLAAALWRFWETRGHLQEGLRWFEQLLVTALAQLPLEPPAAADLAGWSAEDRAHAQALADASNGAGNLARDLCDFPRALQHHQRSLAWRRALDDWPGVSSSLGNLGEVAREQGDLPAARRYYEESLTLKRQLGEVKGIAVGLHNLGILEHTEGNLAGAATLLEESLALKRQLGDKRAIAYLLNDLGAVWRDLGDRAQAHALHQEGLALCREIKDASGTAAALHSLGLLALDAGRPAEAAPLLDESLGLFERLANQVACADVIETRAGVALAQGDTTEAGRLAARAAAVRTAVRAHPTAAQLARLAAYRATAWQRGEADLFEAGWAGVP